MGHEVGRAGSSLLRIARATFGPHFFALRKVPILYTQVAYLGTGIVYLSTVMRFIIRRAGRPPRQPGRTLPTLHVLDFSRRADAHHGLRWIHQRWPSALRHGLSYCLWYYWALQQCASVLGVLGRWRRRSGRTSSSSRSMVHYSKPISHERVVPRSAYLPRSVC